MTIASESSILRGCYITEDRGVKDEGVKVECLSCGGMNLLKVSTCSGYYLDRWLCSVCENNLAIYEDEIVHQPIEYMRLPGDWIGQHYLPEFNDMRAIVIEFDEVNRLTAPVLLANRAAKAEDFSFGSYNIGVHHAVLIVDGVDVVGYLSYCSTSDDTEMVLRQLYLAQSHRRRGLGSAVVEFWWQNVASEWYSDGEENRYLIEGPNKEMLQLVSSLDHDGEGDRPAAYVHHS